MSPPAMSANSSNCIPVNGSVALALGDVPGPDAVCCAPATCGELVPLFAEPLRPPLDAFEFEPVFEPAAAAFAAAFDFCAALGPVPA
jgi:hypothetical protein